MAIYYFDTSALVKYYVAEPESKWVIDIIDAPNRPRNTVIVANVTFAEMCATLGRLFRDGVLSQATRDGLVGLALQHFQKRKYQRRAVTWNVISHAGFLASSTFSQAGQALRGYDAVQLATALSANQHLLSRNQPPLSFVSADRRLLNIAASSGLSVIDPSIFS